MYGVLPTKHPRSAHDFFRLPTLENSCGKFYNTYSLSFTAKRFRIMPNAASIQARTGLGLVRSGVSLQLAGLLWGFAVGLTPFPRLALTAHIQMMVEGEEVEFMSLLSILYDKFVLKFSVSLLASICISCSRCSARNSDRLRIGSYDMLILGLLLA